jgi:hypothetical protein
MTGIEAWLTREPRNRGSTYIVAAGEFVERSALRVPPDGLFLLRRLREGGRPMCFPWASLTYSLVGPHPLDWSYPITERLWRPPPGTP